jgi:hypothetical protein
LPVENGFIFGVDSTHLFARPLANGRAVLRIVSGVPHKERHCDQHHEKQDKGDTPQNGRPGIAEHRRFGEKWNVFPVLRHAQVPNASIDGEFTRFDRSGPCRRVTTPQWRQETSSNQREFSAADWRAGMGTRY